MEGSKSISIKLIMTADIDKDDLIVFNNEINRNPV